MSIQTEFDKELKKILNSSPYNGRVISMSPEYLKEAIFNWRIKAIKQAVDTYVIGKDILPTNERSVNWTDNNLKAEQRLALWGDK